MRALGRSELALYRRSARKNSSRVVGSLDPVVCCAAIRARRPLTPHRNRAPPLPLPAPGASTIAICARPMDHAGDAEECEPLERSADGGNHAEVRKACRRGFGNPAELRIVWRPAAMRGAGAGSGRRRRRASGRQSQLVQLDAVSAGATAGRQVPAGHRHQGPAPAHRRPGGAAALPAGSVGRQTGGGRDDHVGCRCRQRTGEAGVVRAVPTRWLRQGGERSARPRRSMDRAAALDRRHPDPQRQGAGRRALPGPGPISRTPGTRG